jgi:hypothetical protein
MATKTHTLRQKVERLADLSALILELDTDPQGRGKLSPTAFAEAQMAHAPKCKSKAECDKLRKLSEEPLNFTWQPSMRRLAAAMKAKETLAPLTKHLHVFVDEDCRSGLARCGYAPEDLAAAVAEHTCRNFPSHFGECTVVGEHSAKLASLREERSVLATEVDLDLELLMDTKILSRPAEELMNAFIERKKTAGKLAA